MGSKSTIDFFDLLKANVGTSILIRLIAAGLVFAAHVSTS